ncbi:MAG: hypothetical protein R6T85_04585 [Egibacteraceae bacterium]
MNAPLPTNRSSSTRPLAAPSTPLPGVRLGVLLAGSLTVLLTLVPVGQAQADPEDATSSATAAAEAHVEVPELPFDDNPDPDQCGIPQPLGDDVRGTVDGRWEGETLFPDAGTEANPYIITDICELNWMRNDLDAWYELGNDIDASLTRYWNAGAGFVPIGHPSSSFSGALDGQNYTIEGLYFNSADSEVGLFRKLYNATISNLVLLGLDLTAGGGSGTYNGGLTAQTEGSTSISYVQIEGTLNAAGTACTGGLVGKTHAGTNIYRCAAYVTITAGQNRAGGLVFWNDGGTISQCFTTGSVTSVDGFIGGLVQSNGGSITDCYSRCTVYAPGVGWGLQSIGGFAAATDSSKVTNRVYSTGSVGASPGGNIGGLQGSGPCSNSFWDTETSGWETSSCGTGKTTLQMKTRSTFTSAGWDFDTVWGISPYINDGYPFLLWWYDPTDPSELTADIYQVVHFQPNAIISGTTLPNRAQGGGVHPDGTFSWGSNPAGIDIRGPEDFGPEDPDYDVLTPGTWDIIEPEPTGIVGGIDLDRLADNPMSPFVQVLSSSDLITERLAWLLLAIFIVIAAMVATQLLGQHMVFTSLVGFGLTALFYSMGVWGMWVVILMAFGLVASIVYERMPTL